MFVSPAFFFSAAVKCSELHMTEPILMNCSNPWGNFSYGSTCIFHCPEGQSLNGSVRIACQENGQWSTIMPTCQGMFFLWFRKSGWYEKITKSVFVLCVFVWVFPAFNKHFTWIKQNSPCLIHRAKGIKINDSVGHHHSCFRAYKWVWMSSEMSSFLYYLWIKHLKVPNRFKLKVISCRLLIYLRRTLFTTHL